MIVNSTVAVSLLLVTAVAALNLVATVCVIRSAVYSASQKTLQMVFVWVIPLVGAIFVVSVCAHDRKSASLDPDRHGEGPWLPGIGPENEHRHFGDSMGHGGSHDAHGADGGGFGH